MDVDSAGVYARHRCVAGVLQWSHVLMDVDRRIKIIYNITLEASMEPRPDGRG